MRRCGPRAHVGAVTLRRRDRHRAQHQCDACLRSVGYVVQIAALASEELARLRLWTRAGTGKKSGLRSRSGKSARTPATAPSFGRRRKPSGNSRARRYRAFLKSKAWRVQRLRVLERDGWKCQGEGCGVSLRPPERATVHHKSYGHDLENVPDSELAASCGRCQLTERQQRIGGQQQRTARACRDRATPVTNAD